MIRRLKSLFGPRISVPNKVRGAVFDKQWFLVWYQEIVTGEIRIEQLIGGGCSLLNQDKVLVEQAKYLYQKNQLEKKKKV